MEKIKCRECGKIDEILIKESEDYICEDCCNDCNDKITSKNNLITKISKNESAYKELKKKYALAVAENKEEFELYGQRALTQFCKYLLEAVENDRKLRGLKV